MIQGIVYLCILIFDYVVIHNLTFLLFALFARSFIKSQLS